VSNESSYLAARSRRRAVLAGAIALMVDAACAPSQNPCPACPPCAAAFQMAPAAPPPARAAPSPAPTPAPPPTASASAAPAGSAEDPYCRAAGDDTTYGGWEPTADEVTSAIKKMQFVCAPTGWVVQAIPDCMTRLGRSRVIVRAGVMDGDRWTPSSCDVAVSAVKWNGRRWIALVNSVRDGSAFYGFITSVELTARGPVLSTTGCERDDQRRPRGATNPLEPPGWKTFPPEVQERLCH
jgi:hypothetical protein